jgi:hypothetical protein
MEIRGGDDSRGQLLTMALKEPAKKKAEEASEQLPAVDKTTVEGLSEEVNLGLLSSWLRVWLT